MPSVAPGAVVGADRVLVHGPAPGTDLGQCEIGGDPVLVPALPTRPATLRNRREYVSDGEGRAVVHGVTSVQDGRRAVQLVVVGGAADRAQPATPVSKVRPLVNIGKMFTKK